MFWQCGKWIKKQAEDFVKKLVCNEVEEVKEVLGGKVEESPDFLTPLEEMENPENQPGWVNKPPCDRLQIRDDLLDRRKNALNGQINDANRAIKKFREDEALYQKNAAAAFSKQDLEESLRWESKAGTVSAKIAATKSRIAEIRRQIEALKPKKEVLIVASEDFHNCDDTKSAGHRPPPAN